MHLHTPIFYAYFYEYITYKVLNAWHPAPLPRHLHSNSHSCIPSNKGFIIWFLPYSWCLTFLRLVAASLLPRRTTSVSGEERGENTTHISHTGIVGKLVVRRITRERDCFRWLNERGTGGGTRNGAKSFFRPLNVPPRNSREFPGVRQRKPEREIDILRARRRTDTASARIWSRVRATRRKREGELLTFHDTAHARVTDSIEHDTLSSRVAAVLRAPRHSALDSCIA